MKRAQPCFQRGLIAQVEAAFVAAVGEQRLRALVSYHRVVRDGEARLVVEHRPVFEAERIRQAGDAQRREVLERRGTVRAFERKLRLEQAREPARLRVALELTVHERLELAAAPEVTVELQQHVKTVVIALARALEPQLLDVPRDGEELLLRLCQPALHDGPRDLHAQRQRHVDRRALACTARERRLGQQRGSTSDFASSLLPARTLAECEPRAHDRRTQLDAPPRSELRVEHARVQRVDQLVGALRLGSRP